MAKQIIWTERAQNDRKMILDYWRQRNKSATYSRKLNQLFIEAIRIISDYPHIGKPTNDKSARIKIVKDYLIIYQEMETEIFILTIWDSRQNPEKIAAGFE
jgi:addiction module RelE/StbE family toxin